MNYDNRVSQQNFNGIQTLYIYSRVAFIHNFIINVDI